MILYCYKVENVHTLPWPKITDGVKFAPFLAKLSFKLIGFWTILLHCLQAGQTLLPTTTPVASQFCGNCLLEKETSQETGRRNMGTSSYVKNLLIHTQVSACSWCNKLARLCKELTHTPAAQASTTLKKFHLCVVRSGTLYTRLQQTTVITVLTFCRHSTLFTMWHTHTWS